MRVQSSVAGEAVSTAVGPERVCWSAIGLARPRRALTFLRCRDGARGSPEGYMLVVEGSLFRQPRQHLYLSFHPLNLSFFGD